MSFNDEVNSARSKIASEKAEAASEENQHDEFNNPARARFESEVKGLWNDTEEYWRNNAVRMDEKAVNYIVTGRWEGGKGGEVPLPFPKLSVHVGSQTATTVDGIDARPSELVHAVSIGGWFALCAPGEIRELVTDPDFDLGDVSALAFTTAGRAALRSRFRHAMEQSYREVTWSSVPDTIGGDVGAPTFGLACDGPNGTHSVALSCGAAGPIEVFSNAVNDWKRLGTLRELVVAAVAQLPLSGARQRKG